MVQDIARGTPTPADARSRSHGTTSTPRPDPSHHLMPCAANMRRTMPVSKRWPGRSRPVRAAKAWRALPGQRSGPRQWRCTWVGPAAAAPIAPPGESQQLAVGRPRQLAVLPPRRTGDDHQGPAHRVHRTHRRGGRGMIRRLRRPEAAVSGHHQAVAHRVGAVHTVPVVLTGDPAGGIYDRHDRVAQLLVSGKRPAGVGTPPMTRSPVLGRPGTPRSAWRRPAARRSRRARPRADRHHR